MNDFFEKKKETKNIRPRTTNLRKPRQIVQGDTRRRGHPTINLYLPQIFCKKEQRNTSVLSTTNTEGSPPCSMDEQRERSCN